MVRDLLLFSKKHSSTNKMITVADTWPQGERTAGRGEDCGKQEPPPRPI